MSTQSWIDCSPTVNSPTHVNLSEVNGVIERSIQSWPTTLRLKRLAMAPLQYRGPDLQDFEFLLCYKAHACLGIAAWQPDTPLSLRSNMDSAGDLGSENSARAVLLHGLFVSAQSQASGIGGLLLDELTRQARQRGFTGIFVRAERFSTSYFEHKGFHRLDSGEEPGLTPVDYPHRYIFAVS